MTAEPITVRAHLLRLKTAQALPPGDRLSVPLLRLMAATNDVRQAQKCVVLARDPTDPEAPQPPQAAFFLQTGELLYFTRLLFGHLYEAGIIFRGLEETDSATLTKLAGATPEATEALRVVRSEFADTSPTGFYQAVLGKVRNLAAFHYKDATFRDGLEALARSTKDTVLVLAEWMGFSRYAVCDIILDARVVEATGGTSETVRNALDRALTLSNALDRLVAVVAKNLMEGRPAGAVEFGPPEAIPIPPGLQEEARQRRGSKP